MSLVKVSVPYEHDSADFDFIELAVTTGGNPAEDDWRPAYRDIADGKRVVWARFESRWQQVTVWVRDRDGARRVTSVTL